MEAVLKDAVESLRSPYVLSWLGAICLKSCLVLLIATELASVLRRASAATRHLVWCAALMSVLLLPMFDWVLPEWRVALLPNARPSEPIQAATGPLPAGRPERSSPRRAIAPAAEPSAEKGPAHGLATGTPPARPAGSSWAERGWRGLILRGWAWGVFVLLARYACGQAVLYRLVRRAQPATSPAWQALLAEACALLDLRREILIRQSDRVPVPFAWGIRQPVLLLPEESEQWPAERRRLVLLHELAHVKRWDCLTSALGRLTCALYWFNPLVWLAGWRFQVEGERACDDLVLGGGAKPSAYAALLLEMVKEAPRWRWSATPSPSLVYPSSLRERLLAILDAGSNRAQWTRRGVVAALVFLVVAMIPVATLHPAASQPPPPTIAPPSRTAP